MQFKGACKIHDAPIPRNTHFAAFPVCKRALEGPLLQSFLWSNHRGFPVIRLEGYWMNYLRVDDQLNNVKMHPKIRSNCRSIPSLVVELFRKPSDQNHPARVRYRLHRWDVLHRYDARFPLLLPIRPIPANDGVRPVAVG